ncbi:MAG: DNA cytosine methyltransferase [Desulfovibrio sp.]|nr:DNA cytosine methyltransferase [Desulfovibrio sp.]
MGLSGRREKIAGDLEYPLLSYGETRGSGKFNNTFNAYFERFSSWKPGRPARSAPMFNVVDFFCGCGGASLGFAIIPELFNIACGIDINPVSLESYAKNFGCPALHKDVRELVRNETFSVSTIDEYIDGLPLITIGCAPCQGFSAHRKKDWSKEEDDRNSLMENFAALATRLNPEYIIMENVPEILRGKYEIRYARARSIFQQNGYFVTERVYNAAGFYVPQARRRAIVVASRKPFQLPQPVLRPEEYRTARDAIGNLPRANGQSGDPYHICSRHRQSTIDVLARVPADGGSRPHGVGPPCLDRVKGFSDVYGRVAWDKPSVTITKTARNPATGRFAHPEENRGLTVREAARFQGFPDSYIFCGGFGKKFEQIGEAVPPPLALAIAAEISLVERARV